MKINKKKGALKKGKLVRVIANSRSGGVILGSSYQTVICQRTEIGYSSRRPPNFYDSIIFHKFSKHYKYYY